MRPHVGHASALGENSRSSAAVCAQLKCRMGSAVAPFLLAIAKVLLSSASLYGCLVLRFLAGSTGWLIRQLWPQIASVPTSATPLAPSAISRRWHGPGSNRRPVFGAGRSRGQTAPWAIFESLKGNRGAEATSAGHIRRSQGFSRWISGASPMGAACATSENRGNHPDPTGRTQP